MKQNIWNFLKIGNHIADESRKISLKYFKRKLKVQSKDLEIFDPVTTADISIQKKINKIISINFPEHSVLGEEASIKKIINMSGVLILLMEQSHLFKDFLFGVHLFLYQEKKKLFSE